MRRAGHIRNTTFVRLLARETFAVVKLAINKGTGERVAVKIIDKKKCFTPSSTRKDAIMGEVNILKKLNHPNIINIIEVFDTEKTLYLVLELVEGGDLATDLMREGHYSEQKTRDVMRQMLDAVLYLHNQDIAHRDLKPENILLKSADPVVIKLSDFGLSRVIGDGSFMKTMCGTPQFLAPEIITSGGVDGYGKEVDMWSVGAICYMLLCGYCPFSEGKSTSIFDQIKKGLVEFPDAEWNGISPAAKDIIKKLLTVSPAKRYTAQQCIGHPWMKGEPLDPDDEYDTEPEPDPMLTSSPIHDKSPRHDTSSFSCTPTTAAAKVLANAKISDSVNEKKRKREESDSSDTEPDESLRVAEKNVKTEQQHSGGDLKPAKTLSVMDDSAIIDATDGIITESNITNNDDDENNSKHKKKSGGNYVTFSSTTTTTTSSTPPISPSPQNSTNNNNNKNDNNNLHKKLSTSGSLKKSTSTTSVATTEEDYSDTENVSDSEENDQKNNNSNNNNKSLKNSQQSITKSSSSTKLKPLPPCKYGKNCYRKNPAHFLEFSHPQ